MYKYNIEAYKYLWFESLRKELYEFRPFNYIIRKPDIVISPINKYPLDLYSFIILQNHLELPENSEKKIIETFTISSNYDSRNPTRSEILAKIDEDRETGAWKELAKRRTDGRKGGHLARGGNDDEWKIREAQPNPIRSESRL